MIGPSWVRLSNQPLVRCYQEAEDTGERSFYPSINSIPWTNTYLKIDGLMDSTFIFTEERCVSNIISDIFHELSMQLSVSA